MSSSSVNKPNKATHNPTTEVGVGHSSTSRPVRSPLYSPASPPLNYSPNTILDSHGSPQYYPTPRTQDKGKRHEEVGPSRKRARSPFYDGPKYEIMRLRNDTERNIGGLLRHMERVDRRMKKLMKENVELRKELLMLKCEEERNTRWGKQSLAYLKEDVDVRMKMEKGRVDEQLAIREYNTNAVNSRVTNLYDNFEYLYEKQKTKNEKVEEFMKKVGDEI